MALQAEAPTGVLAHMLHSQLFSSLALPARLKQPLDVVWALRFHGRSETDVFQVVHDDLQFMADLQKLLPWRVVTFRGEGDPVETSAQRIHATGLQVQRETASCIEGLGEGLQIVMQRFSTGDHNEAGPGFSSHLGGVSQGIDGLLRVPLGRP